MVDGLPLFLAALVPGYLLGKFIWNTIYNIFFHPLAKFPGPPTSSWSKLHLMYTWNTGQHHDYEYADHKKYGTPFPLHYPSLNLTNPPGRVFRKSPNLISVQDPRSLPLLHSHRAVEKGSWYDIIAYVGIMGKRTAADHRESRKRVAAPFTVSAVRSYIPIITTRTEEWISAIHSRLVDNTAEINLSDWSAFFAYDVISQLCFGEEFGFVREGKDRWGLVEGFGRGLWWQQMYARLPGYYAFVQALPGWAKRLIDGFDDPKGIPRVAAVRDKYIEERMRARETGGYKYKGDILDQ